MSMFSDHTEALQGQLAALREAIEAERRAAAEEKRRLAVALLDLVEVAGMPDSFWAADPRVRLALDALWPGLTVDRPFVRSAIGGGGWPFP